MGRTWVVALIIAGCATRPVDDTSVCVYPSARGLPPTAKNKIDLLFMIDNSAGMPPKINSLSNGFAHFFDAVAGLSARGFHVDLNIGVVTSDYGAGHGAPNCDPSPGGQRGQLQRLGQFADSSCRPPVGANFVHYDFSQGGANNLPSGQDLVNTVRCMSAVGGGGCGYEHQLESVYAALHDNLPANVDFLRDDAMLIVVFVTDEDDGSAPPDTDVFDRTLVGSDYVWNGVDEGPYGYEDSYSRQTRFAVECGSPPHFPPYADSGGPLDGCVPAPNPNGNGPGKMYDVSRYIDFFTHPRVQGGVKGNPNDVVLVGIVPPPSPFQVILGNPGTPSGQDQIPCSPLSETSTPPCVPVIARSCRNALSPIFEGDPAVRLTKVIASSARHRFASICDSDDTTAFDEIAAVIAQAISSGCLPFAIADPANPDCVVEDVTFNADGSDVTVEIPRCDRASPPCWTVVANPFCVDASPQGVGLTIERGGTAPPPNTFTDVVCAPAPVCVPLAGS